MINYTIYSHSPKGPLCGIMQLIVVRLSATEFLMFAHSAQRVYRLHGLWSPARLNDWIYARCFAFHLLHYMSPFRGCCWCARCLILAENNRMALPHFDDDFTHSSHAPSLLLFTMRAHTDWNIHGHVYISRAFGRNRAEAPRLCACVWAYATDGLGWQIDIMRL